MRFDEISGWTLMAIQIVALVVMVPTLWIVGAAFQRSRVARWGSMVVAIAVGAAIAVTILRGDESAVSSYLFASCLFVLGTVMMSICLLAAIPRTRSVAPGSTVAGVLLIVAFVLTYYVLAVTAPLPWLRPAQ